MKKIIVLAMMFCTTLFAIGCGKKAPQIETEFTLYEPCDIFDDVSKWDLPKERLADVFDGTVIIDGTSVKLDSAVKDLENKDIILERYAEGFEEYGEAMGIGFLCSDYEVGLEERMIEEIMINCDEADASKITLTNGTSLQCNSIKEVYEKMGTPDFVEEGTVDAFYREFEIFYEGSKARISFCIVLNYDEAEEEYSYKNVVSQEMRWVDVGTN